MNIINSLAIIALAASVHACFQLSISVLTLMSGHAVGAGKSKSRLLGMTAGFVVGAGVMTILLISSACLLISELFGYQIPVLVWAISCGLLIGTALAVWIFYYRPGAGTALWVPRVIARYITERAKATKLSGEAFGLGLSSVFGELLFIITPILVSALTIIGLPSPNWRLLGIALYTIISMLPLIIVWMLVNGGFSLGAIQKWRETNKRFLQFASGVGLVVIAFYLTIYELAINLTGGL